MKKTYLCIDLKTFYASVECSILGKDPFRTNLVVADSSRGKGTICLAVTPAMKALGVKNRCRLFEIPEDIKYLIAKPKMKKYIEYSANIYAIYLKYVSKDDIFAYSIDECFLDVTSYLKLYKMDAITLAKKITKDVFDIYHITATVGIGSNLFLAKVGLDILSKHRPDNIGFVDEEVFNNEIIFHEPITDIWNIGRGTAKRLLKYKVKNLFGIQLLEDEILKKEFGVKGEIIKNHAFGIEETTIKEIKEYKPNYNSLSIGQVLFRDYKYDEALTVLIEMFDSLILDLIDKNLVTNSLSFGIYYSNNEIAPSGISYNFEKYINNSLIIKDKVKELYNKIINKKHLIRRINVGFNNVIDIKYKTIDLFTDLKEDEKNLKMNKAIVNIQKKYGKNMVLKGTDLLDEATTIERNKLIGGHNGE